MAGGGGGEGEPEFQVAPMIDVLLTILVFFMMITSAQVLKVDKSITLPIAMDALKSDSNREQAIVNVRWDPKVQKPSFVLDDRTYLEAKQMIPILKKMKATGETKIGTGKEQQPYRAVIRGDREVPAVHVATAMNACGEAGIADISFSAINKD